MCGLVENQRSLLCSTCHHGMLCSQYPRSDISEMMSLNLPSLGLHQKQPPPLSSEEFPATLPTLSPGSRDTACFVWETLAQNPPIHSITSESRAWVRSSWPVINIWGEEDGKVGKVETSKLEVKYFTISRIKMNIRQQKKLFIDLKTL